MSAFGTVKQINDKTLKIAVGLKFLETLVAEIFNCEAALTQDKVKREL